MSFLLGTRTARVIAKKLNVVHFPCKCITYVKLTPTCSTPLLFVTGCSNVFCLNRWTSSGSFF